MLVRCVLAGLGGLALAGAFEPLGLALLMPLSLAVLALVLYDLPARRSWLPGLVFGIAFTFSVMVWMRAVGTDAWLAMCAVEAAFFAPLGAAMGLAATKRAWPLWMAAWWVAVETVRGAWPFSGMPFGRLAYATADTVWAQALPWIGMTGVSLLVALTGTSLAWAVLKARSAPRHVLAGGAALLAATLVPVLFQPRVLEDGTAVVAVVQADVPGSGTDVVAVHRDVTENHVRLTEELAASVSRGELPHPDFVVWSENSTAVDPFTDDLTHHAIQRAVGAIDVPILVGAMVDDQDDDEQVLNQGIVWNPGVGGGDRYTKRHPVPYGEYIPFRGSLIPDSYGQLRQIGRDMARGTRLTPLRVGGVAVADVICFDVAYDDGIADQVARGAEVLAVQTSNAMFIDTGQIDQQFEISRLRALETGRWVLVSAINGVSGVVSPDAEVVARLGPRTSGFLVEEVTLSTSITPAVRIGVWSGRMVVITVLLHLGIHFYSYPRIGSTRPPTVAERSS